MNEIETTVEMTMDDALLFRTFREHQENFSIMMAAGVFHIRGGKARLNFNHEGVLDGVDIDVPTFRRGNKQTNFLAN